MAFGPGIARPTGHGCCTPVKKVWWALVTGQFCSAREEWNIKNDLMKATGQFGNQGWKRGVLNLMRATGQFGSIRGEWDSKNNLIKATGQFAHQGVEEKCF